jgi:hypothetical protein
MARNYFKDLTKEDHQYLTQIYYDEDMLHKEKMEVLSKKYGVAGRTIRRWWKEELKLTEGLLTEDSIQLRAAWERDIDETTDIVFVTSAQNSTGINTKGLNNMLAYADHLEEKGFKVQLVIAPTKYRNPTSPTEKAFSKKGAVQNWWRDEVEEYLYYGKKEFGDVLISADSRVRPTAQNPLTGYEAMAKDNHLIIPHSKIHFRTLPRFKNKPLRTMSTTGFITHKNYSDSKSGDRGAIHHSYGFVVLEKKKDGTCHIPRNVKMSSDGSFTDIIFEVKDGKVSIIESCKGLIWGDIHARVADSTIIERSINLARLVNPKKQVLHDVFDGSTVNPHEKKDMFIQRQKIMQGKHLIEEEVQEAFDTVKYIKDKVGAETYISISNHDIFLDRFINDENWKKDLHNSPTYLKYAYIQQTVDLNEYGGLFGYLVHDEFGSDVTYLNYGDSLEIGGYECGLHGDFGANGAKGSYKTFGRLNTKMIHAHSHSPVIHNGVTVVGVTSFLNQYYNRRGMSSWAHAHSLVHNNDKNQLLVFGDDGEISNLIQF